MPSWEFVKLQLAWLEQGLDEFEAHMRMQSYLDAGFDPDMAAAAASFEQHVDEFAELQERVAELEQMVAQLMERLARLEG